MEVDQIQCKFPRISNGYRRLDSRKLGQSQEIDDRHYPDDEEEGENKRKSTAHDSGGGGGGGAADPGSGVGRFYGWPSSRIVRVSRATGGKDRHSKVLTSKGPRDRRVRLSVNTAIQFYDLQDRLGYDQPSKAVEWLLAAAAAAIAELPPMSNPFAETPKQLNNENRSIAAGIYQLGFGSGEMDIDIGSGGGNSSRLQPEEATKSSGGSSNSETSKGSGISISRSESRIKARERAKERAAEKGKERREKEKESNYVASFTELLSGRNSNCINGGDHNSNSNRENRDESSFFVKSSMDYFTSGLLGPPATRPPQFVANSPPLFSAAADHHHHHPELQPFNFSQENLVSAANSPGVAALNRGTLQSNSPPPPLLPRFPPADGSPPNFFGGAAAPVDNHHHFFPGFDARLQLFYGNAHGENGRHFGQKEKEKN